MTRGHKCDYKKQIREELLDDAVAEVIVKLVGNPKFAAMMQEKINCKVDTVTIDGELADFEKQLRQYYAVKLKLPAPQTGHFTIPERRCVLVSFPLFTCSYFFACEISFTCAACQTSSSIIASCCPSTRI